MTSKLVIPLVRLDRRVSFAFLCALTVGCEEGTFVGTHLGAEPNGGASSGAGQSSNNDSESGGSRIASGGHRSNDPETSGGSSDGEPLGRGGSRTHSGGSGSEAGDLAQGGNAIPAQGGTTTAAGGIAGELNQRGGTTSAGDGGSETEGGTGHAQGGSLATGGGGSSGFGGSASGGAGLGGGSASGGAGLGGGGASGGTGSGGATCTLDSECASRACLYDQMFLKHCAPSSCSDGALSEGETAVDCGNLCGFCQGRVCESHDQCASRRCNGKCAAPTCDDGIKNGIESGVDCGGSCGHCAQDSCREPGECASGVCNDFRCAAANCNDGVRNGRETGADCGGSCKGCEGTFCTSNTACASNLCVDYSCTAISCHDLVLNGNERGIDCGGTCAACTGSQCNGNAACASGRCVEGLCPEPACNDGVKNGAETGLDCGGPAFLGATACSRCRTEGSCLHGSDCQSGVCRNGICWAPTCTDGQKNGNETAVDCGGNCSACEVLTRCEDAGDCPSHSCADGVCTPPPSCKVSRPMTCQSRDCCAAPIVEGGSFMVGGDPERTAAECVFEPSLSHRGTVSSFRLDLFEVTVGRFRSFVEAGPEAWKPLPGAGAHAGIAESGWHSEWDSAIPTSRQQWEQALTSISDATWTAEPAGNENQPISAITWFEAFAFCVWDGGRLPTELEWEYAAAGGAENRPYPWGSESPNEALAAYGCRGNACSENRVLDVGSKWLGKGRWGHQDLAGNMGEWVLDWYDFSLVANMGKECNDCAEMGLLRSPGWSTRGTRSGYPTAAAIEICSTRRSGLIDNSRSGFHTGLRCARDP